MSERGTWVIRTSLLRAGKCRSAVALATSSGTILAPEPVRDADTRIGLGSAIVAVIGNMKKALKRVWVGEDLFRGSGFKKGVWFGC